jgi:hypothetical protein
VERGSAKLKIVDALRSVGYDFLTASEKAQESIDEFLASGQDKQIISVVDRQGKCVWAGEMRRKPNQHDHDHP